MQHPQVCKAHLDKSSLIDEPYIGDTVTLHCDDNLFRGFDRSAFHSSVLFGEAAGWRANTNQSAFHVKRQKHNMPSYGLPRYVSVYTVISHANSDVTFIAPPLSYWEERYARTECKVVEWYLTPAELLKLVPALQEPVADSYVLCVGCGSSQLPEALLAAGHAGVTCLDVSTALTSESSHTLSLIQTSHSCKPL